MWVDMLYMDPMVLLHCQKCNTPGFDCLLGGSGIPTSLYHTCMFVDETAFCDNMPRRWWNGKNHV